MSLAVNRCLTGIEAPIDGTNIDFSSDKSNKMSEKISIQCQNNDKRTINRRFWLVFYYFCSV